MYCPVGDFLRSWAAAWQFVQTTWRFPKIRGTGYLLGSAYLLGQRSTAPVLESLAKLLPVVATAVLNDPLDGVVTKAVLEACMSCAAN